MAWALGKGGRGAKERGRASVRWGRVSDVDPAPRTDGKVQVLLGAHSLSQPESSKRLYDVLRAVPHPDSRRDTIDHDLLLLQVSGDPVPTPASPSRVPPSLAAVPPSTYAPPDP